jgi:hypothetical protein
MSIDRRFQLTTKMSTIMLGIITGLQSAIQRAFTMHVQTMAFDFTRIEPQDRYRLLTNFVGPRPIALVSTRSEGGRGNAAPMSFFNVWPWRTRCWSAACPSPPMSTRSNWPD